MSKRQSKINLTLSLTALCLFLVTSVGCEADMTVKTDGKNPPSFSLSGSGRLVSFAVMEVPADNQNQTIQRSSDANILLWEIEPTHADNKIWRLPTITYGKPPAGFTQKFPLDGAAPAPLVEGKIYEVGGPAHGANGGLIWLKVEEGKTVQLPIPGRN